MTILLFILFTVCIAVLSVIVYKLWIKVINLSTLVEENKKRNDILVRVTHEHEVFIEDLKAKAAEIRLRTRHGGFR